MALNTILKKLTKHESSAVFMGMITLAKGALLARLVGLISIPFLTRMYSPDDFGVLALYTALVTILASVLTLRYVQAIPLPKTDVMAFNLVSICFKLIILGSLIMAVVLALFGATLLGLFNMQALATWWPLIVVGGGGAASYELLSMWATRKKQYKILAATQIAQSLSGSSIKIICGLLAIQPAGLLVGQFVAHSAGVGSFIKLSLQDFKDLMPKLSRAREAFIAKHYYSFPCYRLPSQLLMIVSVQAPVLMVATLFSSEATGQLSLAMTALSIPVSLIGSAVAKAYYAEVAALGKNNIEKIREITFGVQRRLFAIGLPVMAIVMIFGEPIYVIVFGEEWREAGRFSKKLAILILFQFTSAPLMEVINVVGRQVHFFIIHLVRAVGLICLFFFMKLETVLVDEAISLISAYLAAFYLGASIFVFYILAKR